MLHLASARQSGVLFPKAVRGLAGTANLECASVPVGLLVNCRLYCVRFCERLGGVFGLKTLSRLEGASQGEQNARGLFRVGRGHGVASLGPMRPPARVDRHIGGERVHCAVGAPPPSVGGGVPQ